MEIVSDDDEGGSSVNTFPMSPTSGLSPGYGQPQDQGPSSTLVRSNSSSASRNSTAKGSFDLVKTTSGSALARSTSTANANSPDNPSPNTELRHDGSLISMSTSYGSNHTGTSPQDKPIRRRKHKNSKLGCPNCKKRRVKCSEDLPSCMNCVKHKVKCGYLDYTEKELNELRQYKLSNQFDELSTDAKEAINDKKARPKPAKSQSLPSNSAKAPVSLDTKSYSLSEPYVNRPSQTLSQSLNDESFPIPEATEPPQSTHFSTLLDLDMNNVLNLAHNSITQDFDNLLGNARTDETPIIYPVYSINADSNLYSGHLDANPYFVPTRDVFSTQANLDNSTQYFNATNVSSNFPIYDTQPTDQPFGSQLNSQFQSPAPDLSLFSNRLDTPESRSLPGAISTSTTFPLVRREKIDYQFNLESQIKEIGPSIAAGTSLLPQIRNLYFTWLNSFIHHSYSSELMFSCLLNLTTNYLICNIFDNCPTYRRYKSMLPVGLLPYQQVGKFSVLLDKNKIKNASIVKSIKYYAKVIKDLRVLLNKNRDPELCSSVSYILSLMSIYDPEATLNSTICFRDGLFGILTYNLNLSLKKGEKIPLLIPVHLKLMKNIARSIYLPGYDPSFLVEFKSVLSDFGNLVLPAIEKMKHHTINNNIAPIYSFQFVKLKLVDLLEFVTATIEKHVPTVNDNLDDISIQEEILFDMIYKWVRLFPSRLCIISHATEPLEKVLYLFYKVFKKALYAIFPQVKFHFLRDFDSPIMSDVFMFKNDFDILNELDHPATNSMLDEHYQPLIPHLKLMTAYLIRLNTFLSKRVFLLYRYIVYEELPQKAFPIDDMRAWRDSISGVAQARSDFNKVLGLQEEPIKSFLKSSIKRANYPNMVTDSTEVVEDDGIEVDIDILELEPDGLLPQDFRFS